MRLRVIAIAAIAVALASLTWFSLRHADDPAPVPSTKWDSAARVVKIPGVDFDRDRNMALIDATHAWAYVDECPNTDPQKESCRSALGYSEDGGRTWHRVTMPDNTGNMEFYGTLDGGPRWLPFDSNTLSLVTRDRIYLTKNRGARWDTFPLSDPPMQTQRAANMHDNFRTHIGEYAYLCVGSTILTSPPDPCPQRELVHLGSGPIRPQPTFEAGAALQGGDGRIWVTRMAGKGEIQVAVSADKGKIWRDLPPTPIGTLVLSPDGSKAIISHHIQQWRLDGDRWVEITGLARSQQMSFSIVMNDGTIAGVLEGKGVYLINGEVIEIPDLPKVDAVSQRQDGTVVFETWISTRIQYVAVGKGPARSWFTVIEMENSRPQ